MAEREIQARIIAALRGAGCYVVNVSVAQTGCPDLLVCANGRFVALEVKTAVGRATKAQQHQMALIEQTGGRARVVRSVADALAAIEPLMGAQI